MAKARKIAVALSLATAAFVSTPSLGGAEPPAGRGVPARFPARAVLGRVANRVPPRALGTIQRVVQRTPTRLGQPPRTDPNSAGSIADNVLEQASLHAGE
jgi:hypothetical protein